MHRRYLAVLVAASLAACTSEPPADGGPAGPAGSLHAGLTLAGPATDVVAFRYTVGDVAFACGDQAGVLAEKVVALEDELLPDGILPEGGAFNFGDALFSLVPGAYRVCVTPLQAGGTPSEDCGPAEAEATVVEGVTVEIVLISQCAGPGSGGLDGVTLLNYPPFVEDLSVSPSKFIDTCTTATISVTASDPNGDEPLFFDWLLLNGPTLDVALVPAGATATFQTDVPGSYLLEVRVDDGRGGTTSREFPVYVSAGECGACNPNPCVNGGTCTDVDGVAVCACGEGFFGDTCELLACLGEPVLVDFAALPTSTPSSYSQDGMFVTGSNTLSILNFNGLGVLGGSDFFLDGTEFLSFSWYGAVDVSYRTNNVGNGDGDGLLGESTIQATAFDGTDLGTVPNEGLGLKNISGLFGGEILKSFRLTAVDNDSQLVAEVGFTPLVQPGPSYDFATFATQQTPALVLPGVTITGSADVHVLNFNGLGIVGGASDFFLNGGETMTFTFDVPEVGVAWRTNNVGNGDGDALLGEAVIEAFDAGGASLGTVAVNGLGQKYVSELFGFVPIKRFSITAVDNDNLLVATLTFGGGVCP